MKNILVVGHCGMDGPVLAGMVKEFGNPVRLNSSNAVETFLKGNDVVLMLVNRIFDNGEQGLSFIEKMHSEHPEIKLMLISNYPEAQEEAKKFNAEGFGKSNLNSGLDLIRKFLA